MVINFNCSSNLAWLVACGSLHLLAVAYEGEGVTGDSMMMLTGVCDSYSGVFWHCARKLALLAHTKT